MRKSFAWISTAALGVAIALVAVAAAPPNLSKALELQLELASEYPHDARIWNDLGNLLVLSGQWTEAEASYRRALEIDPTKLSARFNLGLLLQEQGKGQEALREFRQATEINPRFAWAFYQMGTLHDSWGQNRRAIELYARALALDPQLGFPEINPHVIENTLLTEALLRAHDKRRELLAPQVYDEPQRIVGMLLPSLRAVTEEPERVAEPEAVPAEERMAEQEGAPDTAGRTLGSGDLDPSSRVNQATGRPGAATTQRAPRPRTIRPVQPDAQANPNTARQPVDRRLLSPPPTVVVPGAPRATQPGPSEDAQGRSTTSGSRVRYRPGTSSSGHLEIQLGPLTEPPTRAS